MAGGFPPINPPRRILPTRRRRFYLACGQAACQGGDREPQPDTGWRRVRLKLANRVPAEQHSSAEICSLAYFAAAIGVTLEGPKIPNDSTFRAL